MPSHAILRTTVIVGTLVSSLACGENNVVDASSPDAGPGPGRDASMQDANHAQPLSPCGPTAGTCVPGSVCISGCESMELGGICNVPERDSCGCGAVFDPCDTPGTTCLMPACCDYQGLCVTAEERSEICQGPESERFDCRMTNCGVDGLSCDEATEICVTYIGGPAAIPQCVPLPNGCQSDRGCTCVGQGLCTAPTTECTEDGYNAVTCECNPPCA